MKRAGQMPKDAAVSNTRGSDKNGGAMHYAELVTETRTKWVRTGWLRRRPESELVPLRNATVQVGEDFYTTDEDGWVRFDHPDPEVEVQVTKTGYVPMTLHLKGSHEVPDKVGLVRDLKKAGILGVR